ncbi:hypothetical protein EDB80DRAFT_739179, partial [Ilyonectria destructans]
PQACWVIVLLLWPMPRRSHFVYGGIFIYIYCKIVMRETSVPSSYGNRWTFLLGTSGDWQSNSWMYVDIFQMPEVVSMAGGRRDDPKEALE